VLKRKDTIKRKKIGLLILLSIIVSLFVPSLGRSGISFGIIKAIEKKIDKLRERTEPYSNLPDISTFKTQKSDQFIIDIPDMCSGFPFKGRRAKKPHQGAHVHFDNTGDPWPKGGVDKPENYPPIYAPLDGVILRVDYSFHYGDNLDSYCIDLAFAKDSSGSIYILHYSIEPMIAEPSTNFYRQFIFISKEQEVKKGDIIAYMYTPPSSSTASGIHIHFHIKRMNVEGFMAPALFTYAVVKKFHDRWNGFGDDDGDPIPVCMGYKLDADENPFGTGAVDELW